MGMERLLSVAKFQPVPRRTLYVAYLGDEAKKKVMELAELFRRAGVECLLEFKDKGLKAHMARANKIGAAWVLIAGEDELKKARYPLKDMVSGVQTEGTPEEIIRAIQKSA